MLNWLLSNHYMADIKAGFIYILNWKGLVALIALAMIFKIALSPAFSLYPLLINKHFQGDAAQYGLIESVIGIGIVIGGILLGIWGGFKKKIKTTWLGNCLAWVKSHLDKHIEK